MSKHTPGPWIRHGRYIVGNAGFTVADLQPMGDHNASLIAAAPELLAALQDLCDTLGECGMTEKGRAAIAKATGDGG